eukprot:15317491-Alexandrium_andersonii.AAC.1
MTPNPRTRPCWVEFALFLASERGPRNTDCARITDCRRIRRSNGLPDYGLFQDRGRFVSGQE